MPPAPGVHMQTGPGMQMPPTQMYPPPTSHTPQTLYPNAQPDHLNTVPSDLSIGS